ncbi:Trypanosomal VSG domain containing protein, putative [Trypanosoma equiperdum]|uniref:Trypanosomal VSG domain containing protein, putative n=1 Tax=Trypanosoma equiperdum TaxID=5694 RepID=A0A1G4I1Z6_TRYEQ|nr:Trypanosomal VSG domain containing protein, putative [Trypanosoma equiperdum]
MKPAIWAVLVVAFASRAEGNSAKGENAAAFAALCQPIRLATSTPSNLQHQDNADSITATITAINLNVADDTFTKKIEHDKTWQSAPEEYKNARPGWDKYHDTWVTAKKEITGDNKHKYANWNSFKGNKAAQEQVAHIAEEAFTINSELSGLRKTLGTTEVKAELDKAINGPNGETAAGKTIDFGTSWANRAKICSQTARDGSSLKPGTSLLLDSICLCTMGGNNADAGKACCDNCDETQTADKDSGSINVNFRAKWNKLVEACNKLIKTEALTISAVQRAANAVASALGQKTATQTNYDNVLGTIAGDGSTGCKGNKASNEGKCVVYKSGLTTEGPDAVQWLRHLQAAAQAEESRNNALRQLETKANRLASLNKTLERLFLALRHTATTSETAHTPAPAAAKSTKATKEETEKECNKIGKEADCKANPKCTWNPEEKDETKKCTLSEEGKQHSSRKPSRDRW